MIEIDILHEEDQEVTKVEKELENMKSQFELYQNWLQLQLIEVVIPPDNDKE